MVARTPGKETLPFRSYGISGEWRLRLSLPDGWAARRGLRLRLAAGESPAWAGDHVGEQGSELSRTRRARLE